MPSVWWVSNGTAYVPSTATWTTSSTTSAATNAVYTHIIRGNTYIDCAPIYWASNDTSTTGIGSIIWSNHVVFQDCRFISSAPPTPIYAPAVRRTSRRAIREEAADIIRQVGQARDAAKAR